MRGSASSNGICLLIWLAFAPVCLADSYATTITDAQLARHRGHYALSATIRYALSDTAKTALVNGVPLFWKLLVRIKQPRHWLWDNTLLEQQLRFRLDYHALLNRYRIYNQTAGSHQTFSTLSAALNQISDISNLPLEEDAPLPSLGHDDYFELKMEFDSNALPLPLRPIAAISPSWQLSSVWTKWPLKN